MIKRREADTDGLPPGRYRVASPYDTDARWGDKRDTFWCGYKVHVSETCTDAQPADYLDAVPNLITNVAITDASVPDVAMTASIHDSLARRGLLPDEHLVDSGYPSADLLVDSATRYGISLVTPMLTDVSWQARAGAGYDTTCFTVDFDNQRVTCPQGKVSASWSPARQREVDAIVVKFDTDTCRACPLRSQCTTAGRVGS